MTLSEAIKELERDASGMVLAGFLSLARAEELLIEAGKAIIKSRREHHSFVPSLLPGETEE